jgi:hypothetical protein
VAKPVYLHFNDGSRAAYKDVEAAVGEAAYLAENYPGRSPAAVDVRDDDGEVLADKKRVQAAAKKAK